MFSLRFESHKNAKLKSLPINFAFLFFYFIKKTSLEEKQKCFNKNSYLKTKKKFNYIYEFCFIIESLLVENKDTSKELKVNNHIKKCSIARCRENQKSYKK